jgi:hypothetical protein
MLFKILNLILFSKLQNGDLAKHRQHTTLYEDLCM